MAPSARAFGAGLRPWPSATISYYLCNFCHPECMLQQSNAQYYPVLKKLKFNKTLYIGMVGSGFLHPAAQ